MITRAGVQAVMEMNPKHRVVACVIRGHCRAQVFELPKTELKAEESMQPAVIVERSRVRATIVSDLLGYFREVGPFRHYGTCVFSKAEYVGSFGSYWVDPAVSQPDGGT